MGAFWVVKMQVRLENCFVLEQLESFVIAMVLECNVVVNWFRFGIKNSGVKKVCVQIFGGNFVVVFGLGAQLSPIPSLRNRC